MHGGARERVRGRERGARRGELGGGRVRALEVRCVEPVDGRAAAGVPRVSQCARLVHALQWVGCGGSGVGVAAYGKPRACGMGWQVQIGSDIGSTGIGTGWRTMI